MSFHHFPKNLSIKGAGNYRCRYPGSGWNWNCPQALCLHSVISSSPPFLYYQAFWIAKSFMSSQIKMTYDADSSSNLLICYKHVDSISCDLRVLFGWPLWVSWYMNPFVLFQTNTTNQRITAPPQVGSVATGADTFTFLMIHYLGKRFLEAFIFALIAV